MKEFIIYQPIIVSEELTGNINNISIDTIIRLVKAKNKEEAIGKFILGTKNIQAKKKLDPICIDFDSLARI